MQPQPTNTKNSAPLDVPLQNKHPVFTNCGTKHLYSIALRAPAGSPTTHLLQGPPDQAYHTVTPSHPCCHYPSSLFSHTHLSLCIQTPFVPLQDYCPSLFTHIPLNQPHTHTLTAQRPSPYCPLNTLLTCPNTCILTITYTYPSPLSSPGLPLTFTITCVPLTIPLTCHSPLVSLPSAGHLSPHLVPPLTFNVTPTLLPSLTPGPCSASHPV